MRRFYFTGDRLLSDVAGIVQHQNKIVGTVLQELNFLQHAADIGDTWLQVQPPLPSVTEQL